MTKKIMMQQFRNKLMAYILLCLPIIYGLYLFYIRVIISRAPRDITIIDSNYKLCILGLITLGFAIRIYLALKTLEIIPTKPQKNIIAIYLKAMVYYIHQRLTRIKANFIRELSNRIKSFDRFSLWLIQKCYKYIKRQYFYVPLFICEIGTKLIVVLVLVMEVFYFKQIIYFYKILALLLIPVITKFLISIMGVFYNDNISTIIGFLDSQPIEGTEYHEFCFYDTDLVPSSVSSLNDFIKNHLDPVFDYVYILGAIHEYRLTYKFQYFFLLINICYLIAWVFVLMVGLGLV